MKITRLKLTMPKVTLRRRHIIKAACLVRVVSLVLVGLISSCAGPERLTQTSFDAPGAVTAEMTQPVHTPSNKAASESEQTAIFEVPQNIAPQQVTLNSFQADASSETFTTPVEAYASQARVRSASFPLAPSTVGQIHCQHGFIGQGACPHCQGAASVQPSGPACYPGAPCQSGAPCFVGPGCQTVAGTYKDEYLCDGGNREPGLYRQPPHVSGLETEDTLVQYSTAQGQERIRYSNPVCIYAPRFSEVRSTSNIRQNINVDKALGAHELARLTNLKARVEPGIEQRDAKPSEADVRNRASGYEGLVQKGDVGQHVAAGRHMELLGAYEDLGFVNPVLDYSQTRALYLNSIQAAVTWTRDLNPQISATSQGGNELNSIFKAAGIDGVELNVKPGELVIIKQADLAEAHLGEVVTFTIQFRNTGTEPVNRVTIADNLTPRLGYVEGSQTIDVPADFLAEDNGEGSSILTWVLDEPLAGGAQGKITFKTVVR